MDYLLDQADGGGGGGAVSGGGAGDGFGFDCFLQLSPGMDYSDWMPDWSLCSFEDLVLIDLDEPDEHVVAYDEDYQASVVSKKQRLEVDRGNMKRTSTNSSTRDDVLGARIDTVSYPVVEDISSCVPEGPCTTLLKGYSHHDLSDFNCSISTKKLEGIENNDMMLHFDYPDTHVPMKSGKQLRLEYAERPSTMPSCSMYKSHGITSDFSCEIFPPWLGNDEKHKNRSFNHRRAEDMNTEEASLKHDSPPFQAMRPMTSIDTDHFMMNDQLLESFHLPGGVKADQPLEYAPIPSALSLNFLSEQNLDCEFDAERTSYNCKYATGPSSSKLSLYDTHQNNDAINVLLCLLLYDSPKEQQSSYNLFAEPDDDLMVPKIIQQVSDVKEKLDHSTRLFIRDGLQLLARMNDGEQKSR